MKRRIDFEKPSIFGVLLSVTRKANFEWLAYGENIAKFGVTKNARGNKRTGKIDSLLNFVRVDKKYQIYIVKPSLSRHFRTITQRRLWNY